MLRRTERTLIKRLFLVASVSTFAATFVLSLSAQQVTPATIKQALGFAEAAKASATPADALRAFNQQMEPTFGPTTPFALHQTSSLLVALVTPMTTLRTGSLNICETWSQCPPTSARSPA